MEIDYHIRFYSYSMHIIKLFLQNMLVGMFVEMNVDTADVHIM
jgi:hypothetical protein